MTAILAFFIEREIALQERERAAVSRSVALYQDVVDSPAVKKLRDTAYIIDHYLWSENLTKEEQQERAIKVFRDESIVKDLQAVRQGVAELLQDVKVIYNCGKFKDANKPDHAEEPLCDRHTISILLGSLISEIYVVYKPVMYCDKFIKTRYYEDGKTSGYVGVYETLVKEHMRVDFERRGVDWMVFRTNDDRKQAIRDDKISEDSEHWSILRFPLNRCNLY
ncbi:MAG: hypothetical protein OXN81_07430 [Alphaproteobacteria bacterium]|nr:hypothetical protein [Alphaproteobacteria bacterium]